MNTNQHIVMERYDKEEPCIIHLFEDEKVVERIYSNFAVAFPNTKQKGIVVKRPDKPIHYISHIENFDVMDSAQILSYLNQLDFSKVKIVIFHYLTDEKVALLRILPKHVKVGWYIYGSDLYTRYLINFGYNLFCVGEWKYASFKKKVWDVIMAPSNLLLKIKKRKEFRRVIARIDFVCSIEPDVSLIRHYLPNIQIINYEIYAYAIEDMLGPLLNKPFNNSGLTVVGNSGSETNNHIYVMSFLEKLQPLHSSIYLPLSYCGSLRYKKYVKKMFFKRIHGDIIPIENFMPLNEYNDLLSHLSFYLYGNWRQEAIGNIIVALYTGGKVFLSNRNPLLQYFREKGLILFELETIQSDSFSELTLEDKYHNRNCIIKMYNKETAIQMIRDGVGSFI